MTMHLTFVWTLISILQGVIEEHIHPAQVQNKR